MEYTNWAQEPTVNGNQRCVEITTFPGLLGKWMTIPCNKRLLVVCEKKQVWPVKYIQEAFEDFRKVISAKLIYLEQNYQTLEKSYKHLQENIVPVGFIYVQFGDQLAPKEVWPQFKWEEITASYAGLFFRAEGKGSAPFNVTQVYYCYYYYPHF